VPFYLCIFYLNALFSHKRNLFVFCFTEEIDLGENQLTGTFSEEARHLKFLRKLFYSKFGNPFFVFPSYFSNNCPYQFFMPDTLRLSNNKLSGSVPTTLSELQDISKFGHYV